jgi:hypothetical protein
MHEVDDLFPDDQCKTGVWATEKVISGLLEEEPYLYEKIKGCAVVGFQPYIGEKKPVKPQGDQVYSLKIPDSMLRIAGFFDPDYPNHAYFVAIDCFRKRGQKNTTAERACYKRVAEVRRQREWKYKGY